MRMGAARYAAVFALTAVALVGAVLGPRQAQNLTFGDACGDNTTKPQAMSGEAKKFGNTYGAIYSADNLTQCLEFCATAPVDGDACVAVNYEFGLSRTCYLANTSAEWSLTQLMPDDKVHTAVLPDPLQFDNIDRKWPYTNATIRTVNGLGFQVHCDREPFSLQAGYILTPGSSTNGTAIPANVHTDSFDDCMQFCATMRPTCYGVSYFPPEMG
ncbi:uncharacterized protein AB675_66 [Cyphellophora attinorum]|uniref:Apple domain-containing protein n=1 Tax=Cyphellophora attinorum TaxID=1664694 RepID=A0A0N0NHU4_9EURO|nr:uncharacterized protein AB675_66 [Phialophora attinorum]KPI34679.1 hypothetical protein AB675_66 [Phialophora attinorum]